jgi:hypothetical protein
MAASYQYFGDIPEGEMRQIMEWMEASIPEPRLSEFELAFESSDQD